MPQGRAIGYSVRFLLAVGAAVVAVGQTLAQTPGEQLPGAEMLDRLTALASPCPCPTDPPPNPPAAPFGGPIHDRPKLTGE